ncbi:9929_t:CDS:2 [Ambispora leptoticha]|uniref:9929_t:CDS:1 n=1 Tax=Ambispora leptoticha TaxID=144679 RepID=A0A9N8W7F1_9GLOM|nr:9929_t:CDS:2 [Ambispora leptoticha]
MIALIVKKTIVVHTSLDRPSQNPELKTSEARTNWNANSSRTCHVTNRVRNPVAAAASLRNQLRKAKDDRKKKTPALEGEINETLTFDDVYNARRLPRSWRCIGDISLADFCAYYIYRKNFPFISHI